MSRELLKQALDALSADHHFGDYQDLCAALRHALAAPQPEPVAYLVEGWHDGKLIAHIPHVTLEDAKTSAAVFAQHYTTTKTIPLYAAPPAQPVHQFRALGCSDWYDGHPDPTITGPYETRTLYATPQPAPAVPDGVPDTSLVICPNCCTQFRAIPQDVQRLMIDAGFEPPFVAAPVVREPLIDEMDAVASKYAHKLALDLECVLSDYNGKWWDTAMQTIGEYRMAMNRIHERESPTHMGEPALPKRGITGGGNG